ncbi:hypothetical protein PM082_011767 [Marasmius tenuissimus]|nr:hypothetical protein PM082_011767 [Marasmius tenuissimus]
MDSGSGDMSNRSHYISFSNYCVASEKRFFILLRFARSQPPRRVLYLRRRYHIPPNMDMDQRPSCLQQPTQGWPYLGSGIVSYHLFWGLSVLWRLILGIMVLSETRFSCPNTPGTEGIIASWCGLTITTGTISLVTLLLLSTLATVVIYSSSRRSPLGLRSPIIVAHDGEIDPGPLKGPMPRPTVIRTVLYSLLIVFGITETVFGILHALISHQENFQTIAGLAAALSTISWVWASVLLSYNRRPFFKRTLTNASTHFYSLAILALLMLIIGILILALTQTDDSGRCGGGSMSPDTSCWLHFVDGIMALVLALTLAASAAYVFIRTRSGGGTLPRCNVAQFDGELSEPTLLNKNKSEDP